MWGLYWRYLLSISLSLVLFSFLSEQLNLLSLVDDSGLLPTIFWSIIAIFYISISLLQAKGLPSVFLGNRLHLANKAWYLFSFLTIFFFLALAIIGYLVNQIANKEVWAFYKLFGQPVCLIFIPLFSAWFVTRRAKI